MKIFSKYQSNNYQFPLVNDPDKKDEKYFLAMAEAIYSSSVNNSCGISSLTREQMAENRLFSQAAQSEEIYKKYFFPEDNQPNEPIIAGVDTGTGTLTSDARVAMREGWMNVFWDIVSPAPKITDRLVGLFEKADYRISVDGVDEYSGALIEKKKLQLWVDKLSMEFSKKFFSRMGRKYEEPEFIPDSAEELDLYQEVGGFKPEYALAMELINDDFEKISNWDEVKKKVLRDAIDCGVFSMMRYYDPVINRFKAKWIDPADVIIQSSIYNDYRDSEFKGYYEDMTISELRQLGMKEEELQSVAKTYSGYMGNPVTEGSIDTKVNDIGTHSYDFYKVSVMHGFFTATDDFQDLKITNKRGGKRVVRQSLGTENPPPEVGKYETRITSVKRAYKFIWVVGTKDIFDYGLVYDQVRPRKNIVKLPIEVYRLDGKSITRRLIPAYNQFQILWLKLMNGIGQAVNAGYAIDYDAISNMSMGDGEKWPQEQIIRRFLETGILVFRRTSVNADPNTKVGIPVHELGGSIGTLFTEFRAGFQQNAAIIEDITGFSPMAIGGTPDPEAPVKTSEMAMSATNDSLKNILSAYLTMKEHIFQGNVLSVQNKIRYDKPTRKSYIEITGRRKMQAMLVANKNNVAYGFTMEARPSSFELQEMYKQAQISLANGREGKPGIDLGTSFRITRILNSTGNVRLAEMVLNSSIERSRKKFDKAAKENMKIQQDGAAQIQQQAAAAKEREIALKGRVDEKLEDKKHANKMREITLQGEIDKEVDKSSARQDTTTE